MIGSMKHETIFRKVVTASEDGTAKIWVVKSGPKLLGVFRFLKNGSPVFPTWKQDKKW